MLSKESARPSVFEEDYKRKDSFVNCLEFLCFSLLYRRLHEKLNGRLLLDVKFIIGGRGSLRHNYVVDPIKESSNNLRMSTGNCNVLKMLCIYLHHITE